MVHDKCCFCNGKRKQSKIDYMVKVDNEVIIIKDVPVLICENCGEKFYTLKVSRKMDEIMKAYREGKLSLIISDTIPAREIAFSTSMAALSA